MSSNPKSTASYGITKKLSLDEIQSMQAELYRERWGREQTSSQNESYRVFSMGVVEC